MKFNLKLLLMLLFMPLLPVLAQNSDKWQNEKLDCVDTKRGFIPVSAHFFKEASGWIVGETGEINSKGVRVFVSNGFNNCVAFISESISSYDDIVFSTENLGWIVGSEVSSSNRSLTPILLETVDGGKTWERINLTFMSEHGYSEGDFDSIYVDQNNTGVILGRVKDKDGNLRGIILRTKSDEWSIKYLAQTDLFFDDVEFDVSGKYGWVTTNQGFMLHTEDGGSSWKKQETNFNEPLTHLAVISRREIWVTSQSSYLLHSIDGGKTWKAVFVGAQEQSLKTSVVWYSGLYFDGAGNGWISGTSGLIMRTKDFGTTWYIESVGRAEYLYDIIPTSSHIISIGRPGMLLTSVRN